MLCSAPWQWFDYEIVSGSHRILNLLYEFIKEIAWQHLFSLTWQLLICHVGFGRLFDLEATKIFNSKTIVSIVWWKKTCSYIFLYFFGQPFPPQVLVIHTAVSTEILLPQALRVQGTFIWGIQEWCFRPRSACCSLGPFLNARFLEGHPTIFQHKVIWSLFPKIQSISKASFFPKLFSSVTVLQECPKRSPMETCYRNTREAQPHSKMLSVRLDRYLICRISLLVMQVKLMIDIYIYTSYQTIHSDV